jgi:2,3-bisphosphoglycerate-dependent phosphoglycerate mutase
VSQARLVLVRHGESEWNAKNVFTGWADPPLSAFGEQQSRDAGLLLAERGLAPDGLHTSLLRRAVATGNLLSDAADRPWVPVRRSWRLNGRHYGALQGMDKDVARQEYGEAPVAAWRRSYDARPPVAGPAAHVEIASDPRYAQLSSDLLPVAESLRDTQLRLLPYWCDVIVPQLRRGLTVLVISHGGTLRALIMHLERLSAAEIERVEVEHCVPILYELDDDFRALRSGRRLTF